MKIAIVGAGAIGGWLAARLVQAGQKVSVLARGETLAAIRRDGLMLTQDRQTINASVTASDYPGDLGTQDCVIVAVKGHALEAAAPAIAALMGQDGIVVPAMNGVPWWFTAGLSGPLSDMPLRTVDPHGAIAAAISSARVIGCVVHASCAAPQPGRIVHNTGNKLILGEPDGAAADRLSRISDVLRDAGLDVTQSPRIQRDIWYKLWGNMTMNPISALTGATADRILDDGLVAQFTLAVMAEAAEVGAYIGCPISESGADRMAVTRKLGAFKTSMLQDAEAGRALEIDALLAAPREIAAKMQIATPFMDALHGLIRLMAATRNNRA